MDEDKLRLLIREELQSIIPDIVSEVYKGMPPEVIDYRNKILASKVHNQEPQRDFERELEGYTNRMIEHNKKYPERVEPKPDTYRGLSINVQMGNRSDDIKRIQRRHKRVK
jgi:hypothetical protein